MPSVSQIEEQLTYIMQERARILARETGCIQRERKFTGAERLANAGLWLVSPSGE
jgi:hypothetical protein